jgi:hypothetical protein
MFAVRFLCRCTAKGSDCRALSMVAHGKGEDCRAFLPTVHDKGKRLLCVFLPAHGKGRNASFGAGAVSCFSLPCASP